MSIIKYEKDEAFEYNSKFCINETTKLLLIISQIKTGEKLYTTNNQFLICQNTKLDLLYRYLFGENRQKNITRIQEIYSKTFQIVSNLLNESSLQSVFYKNQIYEALENSKQGLINWLTSYNDDADIIAQINILIKNIDLNLQLLAKVLKFKE
tara:strand:- start:1051 stop:1509 length:459 start_codon:yes stop_codon:yes gene_type:complete